MAQVILQLDVLGLHTYFPQSIVEPGRQVPLPSQVDAEVTVEPLQLAGAQTVAAE